MTWPYKWPDVIPASQGQFMEASYKTPPWQIVKNVGEGVVDFAGNLPNAVASTWILNKPAAAVARGAGNVARFFWIPVASKEEVNKRLEANKFSDAARWSQVWGDPNSKVARTVSTVLNTAELIGWIGALWAGVARSIAKKEAANLAAKQAAGKLTAKDITWTAWNNSSIWKKGKKVLDIVSESENAKQTKIALKDGRLVDNSRSKVGEFLFGTKKWPKVLPSQRSVESAGTILTEIPKASTKPIKLFNQIGSKVDEIWGQLWDKLKTVDVSMLDDQKLKAYSKLDDFLKEPSVQEFWGNANAKKVKALTDKILNAKNADEIRQARKEFDALTPESIKNITALSDAKAQVLNGFWKEARWEVNNLLDEVANNTSDLSVKKALKTMSNLYHGQNNILDKIGQTTKAKKGIINASNILKTIGVGALGAWWLNIYDKLNQ